MIKSQRLYTTISVGNHQTWRMSNTDSHQSHASLQMVILLSNTISNKARTGKKFFSFIISFQWYMYVDSSWGVRPSKSHEFNWHVNSWRDRLLTSFVWTLQLLRLEYCCWKHSTIDYKIIYSCLTTSCYKLSAIFIPIMFASSIPDTSTIQDRLQQWVISTVYKYTTLHSTFRSFIPSMEEQIHYLCEMATCNICSLSHLIALLPLNAPSAVVNMFAIIFCFSLKKIYLLNMLTSPLLLLKPICVGLSCAIATLVCGDNIISTTPFLLLSIIYSLENIVIYTCTYV